MGTSAPKIGVDYLTVSGLPVRVIAVGDRQIELQSLATDSRLWLPAGYPLERYRGLDATGARRPRPHPWNVAPPAAGKRTPRQLAPLIDAMLLAGGKTMRDILRELRRKASAACRGRDLEANVRARTYWLRKRGCRVEMIRAVRATTKFRAYGTPRSRL